MTTEQTSRGFKIRPLLRSLHRDAGYLAVGLTLVYALSGIAVNHIADWDPNFSHAEHVHDVGPVVAQSDDDAARLVLERLKVTDQPSSVYRAGDELTIVLRHRTLHVTTETGKVFDEEQSPRFLLRFANWLHLNRGKKAWTYVADTYAAFLLFLATSGLFMIAGKKGLLGRGAVMVTLGIAIPIAYVVWSGGP